MTAPTPAELAEWRTAIGRERVERQRLELEPLRRFAVAVGTDPDVERRLPPLAHWAFFLPLASDAGLGSDGHLLRGDVLPAIRLPRRMFAAAAIDFAAPLLLDRPAELVSRIAAIDAKTGTTGPLVFAVIERRLVQEGIERVRERQTYVYREAGAAQALPIVGDPVPHDDAWQPDAVALFRFSAATFNGHRIHYDLPYVTKVEGYPGLVVQGPFTAVRLAALAERAGPLAHFAFRAQAALFAGQPVWLRRDPDALVAIRCDGAVAMTAQAGYAS